MSLPMSREGSVHRQVWSGQCLAERPNVPLLTEGNLSTSAWSQSVSGTLGSVALRERGGSGRGEGDGNQTAVGGRLAWGKGCGLQSWEGLRRFLRVSPV